MIDFISSTNTQLFTPYRLTSLIIVGALMIAVLLSIHTQKHVVLGTLAFATLASILFVNVVLTRGDLFDFSKNIVLNQDITKVQLKELEKFANSETDDISLDNPMCFNILPMEMDTKYRKMMQDEINKVKKLPEITLYDRCLLVKKLQAIRYMGEVIKLPNSNILNQKYSS